MRSLASPPACSPSPALVCISCTTPEERSTRAWAWFEVSVVRRGLLAELCRREGDEQPDGTTIVAVSVKKQNNDSKLTLKLKNAIVTVRNARGPNPVAFDPATVKFDDPKQRWKKAFGRRP